MIDELDPLTELGGAMADQARNAGVLLIWRAQARSVRRVTVRQGKTEGVSISRASGHGVQIVTPDGRTALASRDDLQPAPALALLARTLAVARDSAALDLAAIPIPDLPVLRERQIPDGLQDFDALDPTRLAARLIELEAEIASRVPGPQLQITFRAEIDAWRVFRSDGTDVLFAMPRCTLGLRATTGGRAARHAVSATVFSPRPGLPWDEPAVGVFLERGRAAARLAQLLPDAPAHPAGSFPLVIDYALAKGLAHEAFGHAAEADGYRSSILAQDGRLAIGRRVGAEHLSVIDEPVPDDHAWQPFCLNGLRRERVVIVDRGRLAGGLSDPWSAGPGGVTLTGAARAESFQHAPLPRMTNIRIESETALPAPGAFESYDPERVRELLADAGVFRRHPRVVYLSGYNGGQVNTTIGDFVFNCRAIYALGPEGITLHKPAIFSGSMFGALESIREAFGPLKLDALGYCGKWGQSVPSSGGSHYFLVLEPHPSVRLGGS